jgi:hypothetical protein
VGRHGVEPKLRLSRVDNAKLGSAEEQMRFSSGDCASSGNAIKDDIDDETDAGRLGVPCELPNHIFCCPTPETSAHTIIVVDEEDPILVCKREDRRGANTVESKTGRALEMSAPEVSRTSKKGVNIVDAEFALLCAHSNADIIG